MAQEIPETTYEPEAEEDARRKRERRVVQEGTALWRRRKEELQRQKHREQREVCVVNGRPSLLYLGYILPVRRRFAPQRHPRSLTSLSRVAIVTDRIKVKCERYSPEMCVSAEPERH